MWIVDNFLDTWDTNETSKYETYKFLKDTNCKAWDGRAVSFWLPLCSYAQDSAWHMMDL